MWGLLAATAQRRKFWLRVVSTHAWGGGTRWWGGKSSCLLGFLWHQLMGPLKHLVTASQGRVCTPPAFADRVSLCGATVFSVVLWWSRTVTVLTVFSLLKLSLSWSLVRESKYLLEFLCLHPLGPWKTLFFSSKSGTYEKKRKATVRCGSNCM